MRIKKILSMLLVLCFIMALLPVTASAAGTTGTLYKNFSEITNKADLVDNQTYIFLTKHYSSSDAVTTLSGGNATLTMTSATNGGGGELTGDGYTVDKYVHVDQAGSGFDECSNGALFYGSVSFTGMVGTPGSGWYYWCEFGGVHGVGPFYAYTYETVAFSDTDVVVTANRPFNETDTITKSDLTVKVKGYNVSDYTITDGAVSSGDRSYSIDIGGVTVSGTAGAIITFTSHTGGTTTALKQTGTPIYVPASDGTKPGYSFMGWTLTNGSASVNYLPGSEFNVDSSTTLYAVWVPTVTYTITFTADPNSDGSTTTTMKTSGVAIRVPETNGVYAGHIFKGWTVTQGSSTVNYLPGSEYSLDATTTLYAVWEPIVYYTVTIGGIAQSVQSGTTLSVPSSPSKTTEYYDNDNALVTGANDSTASAVKKIVYNFAGWVNQATGQYWNFSTPVTGALTLVADFSQTVSYKVRFNKNNTSSTYTSADQWIAAGAHVNEVSAPGSVTSGGTTYYFAGWNTKQNGSGEFWNFYGDDVSNSLTLYAQWTTVDAYNITFNDNIPDPTDDYVWYSGSLTQNGVAATGYVTAPPMSRVGYVFDGWYTDANCNASNAYNLNRTLNENNIAGIDADHDRSVSLYAKWTSKYSSENDVLVDNSALAGATFAAYYSDYVKAFENNAAYNTPAATPVYRNFNLVNSSGTLVNPSSLPSGLHLNSRTGEIYGVPSVTGNYTFYVRIANDEGKWISLSYPISISIAKPVLSVDMEDDGSGLQKIYGSNDPGFYSNQLSVTSAGTSDVALDSAGSSVTLTYRFTGDKTIRAANASAFNPADAATLKNAPDLADTSGSFVPDSKTVALNLSLKRSVGEDAGVYKLYLTAGDISGSDILNYSISIAGDLRAETLAYSSENSSALTTAAEYVFTINAKPGASYNNGSTVEYGSYASGSDVKSAFTAGSGLVNNTNIKVTDAFDSVKLTSSNVSKSGKLAAGTYAGGFTPVIVNTASPKGTNSAADATTTTNYSSPAFSLTISQKELTPTAANYSVTAGSSLTIGILSKLIDFGFVAGDDVTATITSVTLSGTTYDLTDNAQRNAANAALNTFAANPGGYSMDITYSADLTGTDAGNYSLTAGTVANAKLTVASAAISGGGGGGGGEKGGTKTDVLINGEAHSAGKTETTTGANGMTQTTVTVDTTTLYQLLEEKGSGATVTIPLTSDSHKQTGVLTGEMIKNMENKDATLEIKTNNASYSIPANQIDIDNVSGALGTNVTPSDIKVSITISAPTNAMASVVTDAADEGGFAIAVPAVEFTITAAYNGQTVNVNTFSSYVKRTVAIPDGIDPGKITTGIVVDPDGTVHHVPTKVVVLDGKYYAVINSLTNSTYTVIWHPIEFADVTTHWAKTAINDMGSRMIVTGVDNWNFEPDRDITRAEFAAIVVRALGLDVGMGSSSFADVASSAWYYGYIQTATGYGIIKGYDNGTFGPNDTITREQAMTMIARAMTITKLNSSLSASDASALLAKYKDLASASGYASESIAACLETGVVTGKTQSTVCPKDYITRAEVAVIVERLLQKSNLI